MLVRERKLLEIKKIYFVIFVTYGFVSSFFTIIMDIPIQVMFQKTIPNEIRGSVFGLQNTLNMTSPLVGMLLGGFLIDRVPAFILPLTSGVILIVTTFLLSQNKKFKEL